MSGGEHKRPTEEEEKAALDAGGRPCKALLIAQTTLVDAQGDAGGTPCGAVAAEAGGGRPCKAAFLAEANKNNPA
jgi:hypothetical protein